MQNERVLLKLQERMESLSLTQKKVAQFIITHPEEVPSCSIAQLAEKSGASEATVLRLCKMLGYQGYRQFIVAVTAEISNTTGKEKMRYVDICPGDSIESIVQSVAYVNRQSIEDTVDILDVKALKRAVALLYNARDIQFFGIGASNTVCMDAEQKFARINRRCGMHIDTHSQFVAAALMTPADVAVVLSNSGETKEIVKIVKGIKETGATIIAISRYNKSSLVENADVALLYSTPELTIRSGATGSRIAMLTIIDILFTSVASLGYERVQPYLQKTTEMIHAPMD